jgi:hypothetical protein
MDLIVITLEYILMPTVERQDLNLDHRTHCAHMDADAGHEVTGTRYCLNNHTQCEHTADTQPGTMIRLKCTWFAQPSWTSG